MNFEQVLNLWWLALLPVLWWLARPVRPRRTAGTPHYEQWLRALARLRRRPQRFRWLRFLLLALAFGAVVLAFAGPRLGGRSGPRALVVLLDVSASMAAGTQRAGDVARATLAEGLARVPASVPVTLALCGSEVAIRRGARAELLAALPEPAGRGQVDLAALAETTASDEVAVWTFTDALGPTAAPGRGALTVVGEPAANVAITAVRIADAWPLPEAKVTVEVANLGDRRVAASLTVTGGVDPHPPVALALGPGARAATELALRRAAGGEVQLALEGAGDVLPLDDRVTILLPPPPAPDIAFRSDAESTMWIELAANVLAAETGGRVDRDDPRASFLLVEGGVLAQPAASMRFVTFGTRPHAEPLQREDVVMQPLVLDWDRNDPLTAGLDLSELRIETCLRREFAGAGKGGAGKPLLWAEHGPLAVVVDGPEHSSVHLSFRLADSNFASLLAFPQFLRRCFARAYRGVQAAVAPGALLDSAESDLRVRAAGAADRPLPAFGEDGRPLAAWLLLAALLLLALRTWT